MEGSSMEAEPAMPEAAPEPEASPAKGVEAPEAKEPTELETYAKDFETLATEVEGHLDDPAKQTSIINLMVGLEKNTAFRALRAAWDKLPAGVQNWFAGTGAFGNVLRQAAEGSRVQSEPIRFLVEAGLIELKDPQQGPDTLNNQDVEDLNKMGWAAKIVSFAAPEVEILEKMIKPAMKLVNKKEELTAMIRESIENEKARESAETPAGQIGLKEIDVRVGVEREQIAEDVGDDADITA